MNPWIRPVFFAILILGLSGVLHPQSTTTTQSGAFDMSDFPLWAKDLRRAEIVAFGSFPFTFFFSTTIMDTYRSSTHGWDTRYAPWPVKSAGAIDMTQDELMTVITSAAAASVVVALVDFVILQYKRNKAEQAAAALPPGSPIIIRRPWSPEAESGPPLEGPQPGEVPAEPNAPPLETP